MPEQPEQVIPDQDHDLPHYTPHSLAKALDRADRALAFEIYQKTLPCRTCRRAFQELRHWLVALRHDYPRVAPEYSERHQLFDVLFMHNPPERLVRVRSDEMFQHWGLASLILDNARASFPQNVEISLDLSVLALEIAEHLPIEAYGLQWILDLQGRIHVHTFECYLSLGNLKMAQGSFHQAGRAFRQLLHRPDLEATLDHHEACLSLLQGDQDKAFGLFRRALTAVLHHLQTQLRLRIPGSLQPDHRSRLR